MTERKVTVMDKEVIGYRTFPLLKKHLEKKDGYDWHHIVEQCQIRRSGFSPYVINSPTNVILIPRETHVLISAYYSSKPEGMTQIVRDFLTGKSFEFQYAFGIKVLVEYGVSI